MADKKEFIRKMLGPTLEDVAGDRLTGSAVTEHYMGEGEEPDAVDAYLAEREGLDAVDYYLAEQDKEEDAVDAYLADIKAKSTPDDRIKDRFRKPEPSSSEDFMVGLKRGFRQEVLPYSYTSEELDAIRADEYNWSKFIGEGVGGIAGGVAGGVAAARTGGFIGAIIGSVVPVVGTGVGSAVGTAVALLGYAVYTGWGSEKIQAELMEVEQSDVRAGARTLLNINPVARFGGKQMELLRKISPKLEKVGKAAESKTGRRIRGAAQVVGETAVAATTVDERAGLVALGVSSVVASIVFGKAPGTIGSSTSRELTELLETEVGLDFAAKLQKRQEEIVKAPVELTDEKLFDVGFMNYLLDRPGLGGKGASKQDLALKNMKIKALRTAAEKGKMSQEELNENIGQIQFDEKKAKVQSLIADEKSGGLTQESLEDIYRSYQFYLAGMEEASKLRKQVQEKYADVMFSGKESKEVKDLEPLPWVIEWLADGQAVARATDRVVGTASTSLLNKTSETRGRFEMRVSMLYNQGIKAGAAQRDARINGKKMTNEQVGRLRVYYSENARSALTPELEALIDFNTNTIKDDKVKRAIEEWDKAWSMARTAIEENGYKLGEVSHYVPLRSVAPVELATRIRRSGSTLRGIAMTVGKKDMFELNTKDFKSIPGITEKEVKQFTRELDNIRDLAARATNKPVDKLTAADAGTLIKKLIGKHGQNYGFGTELNVIHSREGSKIADKFREYDIGKAYSRYINSQVRTAMFAPVYSELSDNLMFMKKMKLDKTVDWFEDHFSDIAGMGENEKVKIANSLQASGNLFRFKMREFLENTKLPPGMTDRLVEGIPELLGTWQANLYPAYLGFNVRAAIRNTTQTFATLAPELGGDYGYAKVSAAYLNLAKRLVTDKGWGGITKDLKDAGLLGEVRRSEVLEDVPYLGGPAAQAADWVNRKFMAIYSFADIINRAVAQDVGKQITIDLIQGTPEAVTALKKMGKAGLAQLRAAGVQDALKNNDAKKVSDILGSYFVGKTQYHYGAEQKSRFARFVGPLFSMFSKWNTAQIGNIYDIYKENPGVLRKINRYFEVYGLQLAGLVTLSQLIQSEGADEGSTVQWLIGNPIQISPLTAIEFSVMQNPAFETLGYLGGVAMDALESDEPLSEETLQKAVAKGTKKFLKTSVPPLSSVLNELERIDKDYYGQSKSDLDEFLGLD